MSLDAAGNLYIADSGNHCVRRVGPDGTIQTVAGDGVPGRAVDGETATSAHLRSPAGLVSAPSGGLYIADTGNHRVLRLSPAGTLQVVAGSGEQGESGDGGPAPMAALDSPAGLALLPDGTLLIADRRNDRVRAVAPGGTISTYAGSLSRPRAVAAGANGTLLVAEAGAHQVREIAGSSAGIVLGTGREGPFVVGADPTGSPLAAPHGVVATADGFITADTGHHQLRHVATPLLDFGSVPAGLASQPQRLTVENAGSAPAIVTPLALPQGFQISGEDGCSQLAYTLPAGGSCSIAISFAPIAQGSQNTSIVIEASGALPAVLRLSGTGTAPGSLVPSTTRLSASGSIAYSGAAVVLTATVSGPLANLPAGSLSFRDHGALVGQGTVNGGTASFSTSALPLGTHTLDAVYSGDAHYAGSTSAAVQLLVAPAPDFALQQNGSTSLTLPAGVSMQVPFTLQPVGGALGQAVQLSATGVPAGWAASFTPSAPVLGSDPVRFQLNLAPALTAASPARRQLPPWTTVALLPPLLASLRRRRFSTGRATMVLACAIALTGCGSGYLGNAGPGKTGSPQSYSVTVTATAPGVTGAALVHSVTFTVVVH